MNLPGLVGRAFRIIWNDGDIPGKRWLSQVSRWVAGIESPDNSLVVAYHDNGINVQVNDAMFNKVSPAKIISRDGGDPQVFTCDVYGNGQDEAVTDAAATLKFSMDIPAIVPDYVGKEWWVLVRKVYNQTTEYEGYFHGLADDSYVRLPANPAWSTVNISGTNHVMLSVDESDVQLTYGTTTTDADNFFAIGTTAYTTGSGLIGFSTAATTGIVAVSLTSGIITYNSSAAVKFSTASYGTIGKAVSLLTTDEGTTTSVLQFDTSTEVDLAPESQITTGGYLQTRCKKIKLVLTTDSPPKLQLAATTGYGSWVNGPTVGECT